MARLRYDVVTIADLRRPGAAGRALAAEVEAQVRAGYRSALLHVQSPLLGGHEPWHPALRRLVEGGSVDWVDPEVAVEARLAVAHHAGLFLRLPARPARVLADQGVLVVDHPLTGEDGQPWFKPRQLVAALGEVIRGPVALAPAGPDLRVQLEAAGWPLALLERDWPPVIDPAQFQDLPPGWARAVLTIGCEDLKDPAIAGLPGALADGTPIQVRRLDPDAPAREALSDLDAVLAPSSHGLLRPEVLEALAASRIVLQGEGGDIDLGEAVVTVPPDRIEPTLACLRADPAMRARHRAAAALVAARFAPSTQVARVRALIGEPTRRPPLALRRERRPARRVLLFSSNGIGMGHLTRLLAIARRCSPRLEPVFLSMSQAVRVVEDFGYLAEFTAHHTYLDLEVDRWNEALRAQLAEMIAFYDLRALLFDGNVPYRGLIDARLDHPEVPFLWCRRGMWQPRSGRIGLERAAAFDAVIEPQDVAEPYDRGLTAYYEHERRHVGPILLLDPDELMPRPEARAALGLEADRPALLIQLGSRNNYDYAELVDIACAHAHRRGLQVAVAEWLITQAAPPLPSGAVALRGYPLGRFANAFDVAISAVGYNSYHELLCYGVPTIFVPNEHPSMDDQLMRALFAERQGVAFCVRTRDPYRLREAIDRALDPDEAAEIRRRCATLALRNGAGTVARLLEELVFGLRTASALPWEAELVRRG